MLSTSVQCRIGRHILLTFRRILLQGCPDIIHQLFVGRCFYALLLSNTSESVIGSVRGELGSHCKRVVHGFIVNHMPLDDPEQNGDIDYRY